ncbi:hypothetical protein HDV57DRAFT_518608 [Trichoderma longibrachiatum]|uniref:Uncharacterized protein n=1 Tax=Trichoderma longibrachiatum ATCC 18648 TaxID=983965 RepID=A0A2T4BRY7_TRILO|nr:hypothetical protein M440DRAFT_1425916 [Trichoderma longibrachiatum ATCC 18648]
MQAPSRDERELYYYGLPSRPELVARSSNHVWYRPPHMPEPSEDDDGDDPLYPKLLLPAKHPLLMRIWNNEASFRDQILEAVDKTRLSAIDIMRIMQKGESQNVLMISVKPYTLLWEDGRQIALQCKAILESHGVHDVHCEIRESVVRTL